MLSNPLLSEVHGLVQFCIFCHVGRKGAGLVILKLYSGTSEKNSIQAVIILMIVHVRLEILQWLESLPAIWETRFFLVSVFQY
mmetsp:Transcript_40909/g.95991  ORF Transcript_40909/g.95991 Transcript_40909/m.95991 type:complete len:83 (-) Transcript_40909:142-390(-)